MTADLVTIYFGWPSGHVAYLKLPAATLQKVTDLYTRQTVNANVATFRFTTDWTSDAALHHDFELEVLFLGDTEISVVASGSVFFEKGFPFYLTKERAQLGRRESHSQVPDDFSGSLAVYANDGSLLWQCEYKNGKHCGRCRQYVDSAEVIRVYDESLSLLELSRFVKGVLERRILYEDGKKKTKTLHSSTTGFVVKEVVYEADRKVRRTYFDVPGKLLQTYVVRQAQGDKCLLEVELYALKADQCTTVKLQERHYNESSLLQEGEHNEWYYDAEKDEVRPVLVCKYAGGKHVGLYQRYNANGTLLLREAAYNDNGELHGIYLVYNEDPYMLVQHCGYDNGRWYGTYFCHRNNGTKVEGEYCLYEGKSVKCRTWTTTEVSTGRILRRCHYNSKGFRSGKYEKEKDSLRRTGFYRYKEDENKSIQCGRWTTYDLNLPENVPSVENGVFALGNTLDTSISVLCCKEYDDDGALHGYFFERLSTYAEEARYCHGKKAGLYRKWDTTSGKLIEECTYSESGVCCGSYFSFCPETRRGKSGFYDSAALKHGEQTTVQLLDNDVEVKVRKCSYNHGIRCGSYMKQTKTTLVVGKYRHGHRYDIWKYYELNGEDKVLATKVCYMHLTNDEYPKKVVHFQDGKKSESFYYKYLKPKYRVEGDYLCQPDHFTWRRFDDKGRKVEKKTFRLGNLHGLHKMYEYGPNGKVFVTLEDSYRHGRKHGDCFKLGCYMEEWKFGSRHGWNALTANHVGKYVYGQAHGHSKDLNSLTCKKKKYMLGMCTKSYK